jgi:hypothetical protein
MGASAMASQSRPQLSNSMPCARCFAAPAPAVQGVSAEPGEPTEPAWRAQVSAAPDSSAFMDAGNQLPRLPVRIAFCRWLD